MSDYTPSTVMVYEAATHPGNWISQEEFDRWLNQIKAEVWSEAYQDGWSDRAHPGEDRQRNPYRD